jgi:hypothetical protein
MALGANFDLARSRTIDWIMSCSSVSLNDMSPHPFCFCVNAADLWAFLVTGSSVGVRFKCSGTISS